VTACGANDGPARIESFSAQAHRARTRRRNLYQSLVDPPFYLGLIVSLAVLLFKFL
jgi:hypothetical protein